MMNQSYPASITELLKKSYTAQPVSGGLPVRGIVEDMRWTQQTVLADSESGGAREYLGIQLRIRPEYPHKPFWSTPISSGVPSSQKSLPINQSV